MKVVSLLQINGISHDLSDREVEFVVECFHHKDKPDVVAWAIGDIRDHYKREYDKEIIRQMMRDQLERKVA